MKIFIIGATYGVLLVSLILILALLAPLGMEVTR